MPGLRPPPSSGYRPGGTCPRLCAGRGTGRCTTWSTARRAGTGPAQDAAQQTRGGRHGRYIKPDNINQVKLFTALSIQVLLTRCSTKSNATVGRLYNLLSGVMLHSFGHSFGQSKCPGGQPREPPKAAPADTPPRVRLHKLHQQDQDQDCKQHEQNQDCKPYPNQGRRSHTLAHTLTHNPHLELHKLHKQVRLCQREKSVHHGVIRLVE